MESQDFGHEHPLVFNEEEQSNQSEEASPHKCSRCGEVLSGPSYCCAECPFYLHKECAEAPSQIDHPFHRSHPLSLLPNPPAKYKNGFVCDFCGEDGNMFVYHCSSCDLDFHIKCALVTYNFAEKKVGDQLNHIACKYPSISTENGDQLESAKCFGCWEPLFGSIYSLGCGFTLHQKCAELPFQMNSPLHHKHPLILQLSGSKIFSCVICQDTDRIGFFYGCSLCNFGVHIVCLSPPSIIEDKGHQHPFTMFFRPLLFRCDACGMEGKCVPYTCSNCNLLVHKNCTSLPRAIKMMWHEHPISHTYSFQGHESEKWECVICRNEVNTDYGSYYCSGCHFIVHVRCVLRRKNWYRTVEPDEIVADDSTLLSDASMGSFTVIENNENGEATKIKHFTHVHDLILSVEITKDDKYCDGCTLFISDLFYYCSECNYFLHKKCAEFPKKKHIWFHMCQELLRLTSGYTFYCNYCESMGNGFAYKCNKCKDCVCLRCVTPDILIYDGHEHRLPYYMNYEAHCNACGVEMRQAYACKECKFALHSNCAILPLKARHKCDQHPLTLAYHDDNTYSKTHFCDICEEDRNPNYWFYHCAICSTSAHTDCVLGRYPFFKLGKSYLLEFHPHRLALVKKMYYYPKCIRCDKPCQELALECTKSGCAYIIHADHLMGTNVFSGVGES